MQCTNCHKTLATIHIIDLDSGVFVGEQRLCPTCAEAAGYVHSKSAPLQLPPQMLEDLLGGMKTGSSPAETEEVSDDACPACGLTIVQFRTKGRLGCPRCYEMFRQSLIPLLERVHDGTTHRGRCPGKPIDRIPGEDEQMDDLRSSLRDAIDAENYELAAQLRDQIEQRSAPGEESMN